MTLNRPQVIASAEKLVSRGKIEAAVKEYRKLLAENPNDASTLNRLGDLYARLDRIDEAVRLFSQIADRYTDDGFFVKAIAIYKKIIKLDPTRLAVYERLAELYHKQGLIPEARTQYQVLYDYYQKHANSASAIGILQRMAVLVPDDPAPHVKLAEIFHQQKLTDKALAEYRLIADLMLRHNKVDEATAVYAKAIEAEPGDIAFITDAVLGLKDAGHTGAAARLLALAVDRNPQAEKIARIAGLSRGSSGADAPVASLPTLKVSDVTKSGSEPRDTMQLDASILESSMMPPARGTLPPMAPQRPSMGAFPPLLAPVDEGEIDFVLELPEELDAPSTQISPTDDMLQRSPDSPWFEESAAEPDFAIPSTSASAPEVSSEMEFELELEGLESLVEASPGPASPFVSPAGLPDLADLGNLSDFAPAETAMPARADIEALAAAAAAAGLPSSEEAYEIDWSFEPEPELEIPATPVRPGAPLLNLEELERTSYEVVPPQVSGARRQDDLLAEAEVFRKYGLREKAHDRLRELLQANPRHVGANGLLITLWIDEGKNDKAMARANQLAGLASDDRDENVWMQVRNRLVKAGFQVEGDRVIGLPVATPKKKDRIASMLDDLAGLSGSGSRPAPKPLEIRTPRTSAEAEIAPLRPAPPLPVAPTPASRPIAPPVAHAQEISAEPWHVGMQDGGPLDAELPEIIIPIATPKRAAAGSTLPATSPANEPVRSVTPERIAADESLSWLDQAVATPAAAARSDGESLFEEEEGFFDLAAELEQELSKEDLLSGKDLMPTPQEQSLEEIVEGFKRGVAESLSAEDYDTHYNLGIAYREMGLLDEAIGEFQLASKEPRYLVDCASLLGGCFLEKGLPELAIKWFQRGLEIPHLPEEALLGLLYDLGNVYIFQGDQDKARHAFVEIYGVNSNYRDVVAKLAELDRSH
ncbi:MAG: tetratricopeptide repeat protein [Thermoanaerobaculia bacterium]